jgi:flagellar motor switch protein FliM
MDPLLQRRRGADDPSPAAKAYDFRRPDRIAKDQLRAIQLLHENFARNLTSSLSAYLRAYVAVNLVSMEQFAFMEFTQSMASPTCLVTLGMKPMDGHAILEIAPSLAFPVLELLLGGMAKKSEGLDRKITAIEQSILDDLIRVVLNDLRAAWESVTPIEFSVDSHETEPGLLQNLGPHEAVVAFGIEVHVGEAVGMLNLGIPSITVKMLRHKFDQSRNLERRQYSEEHQRRVLRLIGGARLEAEARLQGPAVRLATLLELGPGDVLAFDHPVDRPLEVTINGKRRYLGEVIQAGNRRAVQLLSREDP